MRLLTGTNLAKELSDDLLVIATLRIPYTLSNQEGSHIHTMGKGMYTRAKVTKIVMQTACTSLWESANNRK